MTNREFREAIVTSVTDELDRRNLSEYIKVPVTSERKQIFKAHLQLTSLGRTRFETAPDNPTTQITHRDISHLKINEDITPIEFQSRLEEFKGHAVSKVDEFYLKIR